MLSNKLLKIKEMLLDIKPSISKSNHQLYLNFVIVIPIQFSNFPYWVFVAVPIDSYWTE